jgi:hypothetical protein
MHGGRRPKSLEGGNRGGVRTGSDVGLWGFSAGVWPDLSVSNRDGGRVITAALGLVAVCRIGAVVL